MNSKLKAAFEHEMAAAGRFIRAGYPDRAMRHLERAHVLGQRKVIPHVRTHWGMLGIALKRRAAVEGLGQAMRIVLGALGSALGIVPVGNTGGTNMGMFARLPIDPDLVVLMEQDRSGR